MDIITEFIIHLDECQSWFDVVALCYEYLIDIVDNENVFIGTYIETNNRSERCNPNLEQLHNFKNRVKSTIMLGEEKGRDIDESVPIILQEIYALDLKQFQNENHNKVTILFFLLLAIDQYYSTVDISSWKAAPLNKKYRNKSYVYFSDRYNILHEAIETLDFGKDVLTDNFQSQFNSFRIIETKQLPPETQAPHIVTIPVNPYMRSSKYDKKLKIGIIPFAGFTLTEFFVTVGSCFVIRYPDDYLDRFVSRARSLLDTAIDHKANIIIFPEYVMSPELQKAIGNHLSYIYQNNPERLSELKLVIAGSGWTDDNNNVMLLFDYTGTEIGQYYKYSPFQNTINGDIYREFLCKPGLKCTLVDVPGIGRILPAICRDVVNHEITDNLACLFRPFAICISAWSKSIHRGFSERLRNITNCYYTSSVVCNCCEAFHFQESPNQEFREDNGFIGVPMKQGSTVICQEYPLSRVNGCNGTCREMSCVYVVDMDYSVDKVKNHAIVDRCQRIPVKHD